MASNEVEALQVELLMGGTENLKQVKLFNINSDEIVSAPAAAIADIQHCAEEVSGQAIVRITYQDDDGDWCTLNEHTISDAIVFAKTVQGLRRLPLHIVTKATPSISASAAPVPVATTPTQSAVPQSQPEQEPEQAPCPRVGEGTSVQAALREFERLACDVDLRSFVQMLAAAALRIINEVQLPELFPLIETAWDLQDGKLQAESVALLLPQIVGPFESMPPEVREDVLRRFKQEAESAAADLRQQHSKAGTTAIEVHPTIACDGCGASSILGPRYKSLDRDTFNICQSCYDAALEDSSLWVRVESSVTAAAREAMPEQVVASSAFQQTEKLASEHTHVNKLEAAQGRDAAAAASVENMCESMLRSVLTKLLDHPDKAMRSQAIDEVEAAATQAPTSVQFSDRSHAERLVQDQHAEQESAHKQRGLHDVGVIANELPPAPSARVLSSSGLTAGDQAQEDVNARGDITSHFAVLLFETGAKQAFCAGRALIPAGLPTSEHICAKVVLVNDGTVPWPAMATLAVVAGDALGCPQISLAALQPGEAAEVRIDLCLPAEAAQKAIRSVWALVDAATGQTLGPLIFFETIWV